MTNKQKGPVRRLHNIRAEEISVVDKAAGENCHIKLTKRDRTVLKAKLDEATARLAVSVKSIVNDPDCNDKRQMLATSFGQFLAHVNPRASIRDVAKLHEIFARKNTDDVPSDFADRDEDDEPTDNDGADENGAPTKHLNDLVESLDKQQKEQTMRDPMRRLKSLDAISICKTMSSEGSAFGLSEADLVDLISTYGKAHGKSFVDIFTAQDETGLACRKAVDIAKHAGFASRTTTMSKQQSSSMFHAGGDGYFTGSGAPGKATLRPRVTGGAAARNVNDPRTALDQLQELVDAQRAQHPELTEAGAFAQVYAANPDLAAQERRENRPVATGW